MVESIFLRVDENLKTRLKIHSSLTKKNVSEIIIELLESNIPEYDIKKKK